MTFLRIILAFLLTLALAGPTVAQPGPGPRGGRQHEDGRGPPPGFGPGSGFGQGFGPGGGRGRPDHDRNSDGEAGPRGRGFGRAMGPREIEDYWEANKQKIIDFCKAHSPNRWASIERWMQFNNIRDFKPPRDRLLFQIMNLLELETSDPELYKLRVEQIRAEDDEYKLARDYARATRSGVTEDATTVKEQLRLQARKTIKLRLAERELRLARLQERLDEEKQRLANDTTRPDSLVEAHVKQVLENPPGPPRRGPGFPPVQTAPASAPAAPREADNP